MSLVSINCVNNIECYWSRLHSLSVTHCLPRVLLDLFLGQCHQLPLLLPLGLHLNHFKPLSATVVALIRFISHLNIKICKLLSFKLQIKQIRVVFRRGGILKNFDSIEFKMAAFRPLFTFTWPIFGKPC